MAVDAVERSRKPPSRAPGKVDFFVASIEDPLPMGRIMLWPSSFAPEPSRVVEREPVERLILLHCADRGSLGDIQSGYTSLVMAQAPGSQKLMICSNRPLLAHASAGLTALAGLGDGCMPHQSSASFSKPLSIAKRTNSARLLNSILAMILLRCVSTVRSEIDNLSAISAFVWP